MERDIQELVILAGWKNIGNYVQFTVDLKESGIYNLVLNADVVKKDQQFMMTHHEREHYILMMKKELILKLK